MRRIAFLVATLLTGSPALAFGQDAAIAAFNAWCFKAGQTESEIRANMTSSAGTPLPFDLVFWDVSLEPVAAKLPRGVERRCDVSFEGNHTAKAVAGLRKQMATKPVFGTAIPLPDTHQPLPGTVLIEGRELLQGRVAVVHVGMRDTKTFIAVDRLFDGLGLTQKGE